MRKNNYVLYALIALLLVSVTGLQAGCKETENTGPTAKTEAEGDEKRDPVKPVPGQGFQEFPIGDTVETDGLAITPIYFQSVDMEPKELAPGSDETDIHLEADVVAIEGNKTGFGIDEFVPYVTVKYEIKDDRGTVVANGSMMPMNASDGAHYGVNVKMPSAGKYKLKFILESPEKQAYVLHVDKETGVEGRFWKKPIELEWDFNYVPVKK